MATIPFAHTHTPTQLAWRTRRYLRAEEERRLAFIVSKDVRSLIGSAAVEAVRQASRKAAQAVLRRSLSRHQKAAAVADRAAAAAVAATDGPWGDAFGAGIRPLESRVLHRPALRCPFPHPPPCSRDGRG